MLKDVQLKAITLLLSGRKLGDIASELAISREMLWMWRAQDVDFILEYETQRNEIIESSKAEIFGLLQKAISVLKEQMDVKAALEIVKLFVTSETSKDYIKERCIPQPDELAEEIFEKRIDGLIKSQKTLPEIKELVGYSTLTERQQHLIRNAWATRFEPMDYDIDLPALSKL